MPRQFYTPDGLHVPFIAAWSSEPLRTTPVVLHHGRGGAGIGYKDEDSDLDRSTGGVLWVRVPATRGVGEAHLAKVHPLRQRAAMDRLLCQVCGEHTYDPRDKRRLFLLAGGEDRPIREGERTAAPPVHAPCAQEAIRDCRALRKGWSAALVRSALAWGVAGIVHDPATLQPLPDRHGDGLDFVGYDDPLIRWTLAHREVVRLTGVTPITPAELDAMAA
ncbi:hypothetical protein ACFOOM_00730 [Streptomyces echinoruber]|uniref:Uncharacterized protein n=1 Tax=Streptomyces echinoruber TaxID=68898 RepID=A0A918QW98_9ACTN|nr:hypothetical protein [Streptomyces echinoruber]GGZ73514.1 hypothetical protein GCM10010389_08910 [Streptomyces echinoruber]